MRYLLLAALSACAARSHVEPRPIVVTTPRAVVIDPASPSLEAKRAYFHRRAREWIGGDGHRVCVCEEHDGILTCAW